jgi:hypothetical protein
VREFSCSHYGRVGDLDPVMHLVFLLQSTQNGDGGFDAGLANDDLLEAALECGIFLDVFSVLI